MEEMTEEEIEKDIQRLEGIAQIKLDALEQVFKNKALTNTEMRYWFEQILHARHWVIHHVINDYKQKHGVQ